MSGERPSQLRPLPPHCGRAFVLALFLSLTACTPRDLFLGTGAAIGTAALQERGIDGAFSDTSLRLAISDAWFKASLDLFGRCNLMISRRQVVITGRVPDQAMKQRAEQLARQAGATEIVNQLTIGPDVPLMTVLQDRMIASQLRGALTFDRDVSGVNYAISVEDGVVYLGGIAHSEAELRRVTYLASDINGTKLVKSFVQVPESSYAEARPAYISP